MKTRSEVLRDLFSYQNDNLFLNSIFHKLVKDGYLICHQVANNDVHNKYEISCEGLLFLKDKGYKRYFRRKRLGLWLKEAQLWLLMSGTVAAALFSGLTYLHSLKNEDTNQQSRLPTLIKDTLQHTKSK